ncbi:MAG TPA: hypothetical protein VJW23_04270 [Propionibacteriaceae bacterium]|nr:hypothetical protein [Propionibacteriaceae bacterium]
MTTREEGGRRLVTLTSEGRAQLEERRARLGDPFADFAVAPDRPDLRDVLRQLRDAVRQIEVGGDATQLEVAANVLVQTRRSLYLILAREAEDLWPLSEGRALVGPCGRSQRPDRFSTAQAQSRS